MAARSDVTSPSGLEQGPALRIFVAVGTTRFDSLIRAVFSDKFLDAVAQLVRASPNKSSNNAQLVVQYGNSSIADILTSSTLAKPDKGSEIVPEPGMRMINGRRVYQNAANAPALDPGQTGTISGLRLRNPAQPQHASAHGFEAGGADPRSVSKGIFESIVQEAKAMHGVTAGITGSIIQGAILEAETDQGVELQLFQFAPDLKPYIRAADVVISHAGSGTILDTLRMRPKTPTLVVVPNTSLMDNHQVELAEALGKDNYLIVGSEETLADDVARACTTTCEPFPDSDPSRFIRIVDEIMQF